MASRQEEKEARRQERMEQEERERKAASRTKRAQYVIGGALAVGIVAAVVVALLAGTGGDSDDGGATSARDADTSATLPEPAILDEAEAATAAGCELTQVPNEGRGHEEKDFTEADYESNPPTSGTHFPVWSQDGIYEPGKTPPLGETVHTLEHGRIDVQYKPGTDPALVDKLEAFLGENDGYHMLLFENATNMEAQVVATAWDFKLECPEPDDKLFDALRTFRDAHIDRGPEKVA